MSSVNPSDTARSFVPHRDVVTGPAALEIDRITETDLSIDKEATTRAHATLGPKRILMVATDFVTPYRVLRCAHATGAEIYVLGNAGARALRFSRYCQQVFVSDCIIHGDRDEALALEINCLVRKLGISMVMPADAPSIRAVIASRDMIEVPCFPLPSLETFDFLNNKWTFAQLCIELGIRHPVTRLLPDVATFACEIALGDCEYPLIVKPLDRNASAGVLVIDGVDSEKRLSAINYRPLLVQKFISGQDIGASVFVQGGSVKAFVAHWYRNGVYCTFQDDQIYSDIAKIASHLHLDGVYNFDMMLAPDGSVFFLECNPRFFYKINLSMIAGINFVEHGVSYEGLQVKGAIPPGVQVRFPKALMRSLVFSGQCTKRDWAMFTYLFSDPWPFLMEKLNLTI